MKKALLFVADIAALYLALSLMILARHPSLFAAQFRIHAVPFTLLFAVWLIVFYINGLFDTQNLRNNASFYSTLFRSIAIASVLSVAFFYITPIFGITPRTNLFIFILIFTALETANRAFFNSIIEQRFHKRTLIVGINPIARELAKFLKQNPQLGYELRYIVDPSPNTFADTKNDYADFGIIQGLSNIEHVIRTEKISVVILSPEAYHAQEMIDVFYKLLEHRVNFYNLASIYEKLTGRVPLDAINQIWFLENISEGSKRAYEALKRTVDIALTIIGGAGAIVLFPFIALGIKMSSAGPLLYKQERVGRLGKKFTMVKYRTMIHHAERESGAVWTQENDPRITRFGSVLRKTRLDELPQLWNIFKGDMSFIGPRAERPEFHEQLVREVPYYEERYLIKPGATGWAQLQKSYYASVTDTKEKLQYDLFYIKNRSFALDLDIFLKTLNLVIRGGGR